MRSLVGNFASRRAVGEREPISWTRRPCAVRGEFVAFLTTEMAWRKLVNALPADVPFSCLFGDGRPSHVVRANFASRRPVGEREPKSRTRRPCAVRGEFVAFGSTEMAFSNKTGRFPEFFSSAAKKNDQTVRNLTHYA